MTLDVKSLKYPSLIRLLLSLLSLGEFEAQESQEISDASHEQDGFNNGGLLDLLGLLGASLGDAGEADGVGSGVDLPDPGHHAGLLGSAGLLEDILHHVEPGIGHLEGQLGHGEAGSVVSDGVEVGSDRGLSNIKVNLPKLQLQLKLTLVSSISFGVASFSWGIFSVSCSMPQQA